MNKKTNIQKYTKPKSTLIGIALAFAMILLIPITYTAFAKPNFDATSHGRHCEELWDAIEGLKNKKARQGGTLNQQDATILENAENEYNDICKSYYGPHVLVKNPAVTNPTMGDDIVAEQPQQSDSKFPRGITNNEDMVNEQTEQPQQSDSKFSGSILSNNNMVNTLE